MLDSRFGQGEVDDHVGGREKRCLVRGSGQSQCADARQIAQVGAYQGAVGPIHAAGDQRALLSGDRGEQHAAHAPSAAEDPHSYVHHLSVPWRCEIDLYPWGLA